MTYKKQFQPRENKPGREATLSKPKTNKLEERQIKNKLRSHNLDSIIESEGYFYEGDDDE